MKMNEPNYFDVVNMFNMIMTENSTTYVETEEAFNLIKSGVLKIDE